MVMLANYKVPERNGDWYIAEYAGQGSVQEQPQEITYIAKLGIDLIDTPLVRKIESSLRAWDRFLPASLLTSDPPPTPDSILRLCIPTPIGTVLPFPLFTMSNLHDKRISGMFVEIVHIPDDPIKSMKGSILRNTYCMHVIHVHVVGAELGSRATELSRLILKVVMSQTEKDKRRRGSPRTTTDPMIDALEL